MLIVYSDHATKRMKQRGITELEIGHILSYSEYIKKSRDGTKEAFGKVNNKYIRIFFVEEENLIRIVTLII